MKLVLISLVLPLVLCFKNMESGGKAAIAQYSMKLEVKTYPNDSITKGWGYDIYADDALYIHQPNIPAVSGNIGFKSEQNARIAGNFAVHKIKNNILPPTISIAELDSLGVLK